MCKDVFTEESKKVQLYLVIFKHFKELHNKMLQYVVVQSFMNSLAKTVAQ